MTRPAASTSRAAPCAPQMALRLPPPRCRRRRQARTAPNRQTHFFLNRDKTEKGENASHSRPDPASNPPAVSRASYQVRHSVARACNRHPPKTWTSAPISRRWRRSQLNVRLAYARRIVTRKSAKRLPKINEIERIDRVPTAGLHDLP